MIEPQPAGKQLRQMVWGGIWWGMTRLVPLERDFEAKKYGYTSKSYLQVMDKRLLDFYTPELLFAQDNAPIHKSKVSMKWFQEKEIKLIEMPPYSPDMNCIENMWMLLKQKSLQMFPELVAETSDSEEARQRLIRCLQASWIELDLLVVLSLIESMPRRVRALHDAGGWHTKY